MADTGTKPPVILMNDAALSLHPDLVPRDTDTRVIVAGQSRVRMMLAEVALQDSQMIWTDFSQSASLAALETRVRAEGRLHRLVLAADGSDSAEMFMLMRTIVTFLPALRRGKGGLVMLVEAGAAVTSLIQFLRRLRPTLDRYGIAVDLRISPTGGLADCPSRAQVQGLHR